MPADFFVIAYGRTVLLETDDPDSALPFLPATWTAGRPDAPVDRSYRVARTEDGRWGLWVDGEFRYAVESSEQLVDLVEGDLHHYLATYTRDLLFVHAGCVAWKGQAIVLPGRSTAGKTTLTQALLDQGAVYYSDDYAVIDREGAIHPFPRWLRVRGTAAPGNRVDPVASNWPIGVEPVRAALTAKLTYNREAGWSVETVSHGQGALGLLDNTVAARERPVDALRIMSLAVAGAMSIEGTRGEAGDAAARLIALVESTRTDSDDLRGT